MFEWPEELQMVRAAVRDFVDQEIRPHRDELEHGDMPPYDLLRKLYAAFGIGTMARDSFERRIAQVRAAEDGTAITAENGDDDDGGDAAKPGFGAAMAMMPIIELCKCSPGMVTALGVSVGLTAAAIESRGTIAQRERWVPDLLTLDTIGAWAITEPGSGSGCVRCDALDRAPRRRRVPAERIEDVHHQRAVRRHDRLHLQARRRRGRPARPQGVPVRARRGHARSRAEQAVAQDGPALVADRHVVPRRRAGRARPPARRDRGSPGSRRPRRVEGDVHDGAHRRRGDGAGHHRTLPRAVRPVREGAGAVRAADRQLPA